MRERLAPQVTATLLVEVARAPTSDSPRDRAAALRRSGLRSPAFYLQRVREHGRPALRQTLARSAP